VTTENLDYCWALAEQYDLSVLQTACIAIQKAQLRLAAQVCARRRWQLCSHLMPCITLNTIDLATDTATRCVCPMWTTDMRVLSAYTKRGHVAQQAARAGSTWHQPLYGCCATFALAKISA
jgi:hypothetical protein